MIQQGMGLPVNMSRPHSRRTEPAGGFGPSQRLLCSTRKVPSRDLYGTLPFPGSTRYHVWQTFMSQAPGLMPGPGGEANDVPGHQVCAPGSGSAAAVPAARLRPAAVRLVRVNAPAIILAVFMPISLRLCAASQRRGSSKYSGAVRLPIPRTARPTSSDLGAERHQYDADFEIAAEVLPFQHRWALERGTIS